MTGIMCALVGSGSGSDYSAPVTVTVGSYFDGTDTYYGYQNGLYGSISPSTWGPSSLTIIGLFWANYGAISFALNGVAPNSGWTTMTIGGVPFSRASATYFQTAGTTQWSWSTGTNPFGTSGTKIVTWQ